MAELLTHAELQEAVRYAGDQDRWKRLIVLEKRYVNLYRRRFNSANPAREDAFRVATLALFAEEASTSAAAEVRDFVIDEFEDDSAGKAAKS